MKVTNLVCQAFNRFKSSQYHIRGKPKRIHNDPASIEQNLSKKEQYYRQKLERLEKLENFQLSGGSIPKKV